MIGGRFSETSFWEEMSSAGLSVSGDASVSSELASFGKRNERRNGLISDPRIANATTTSLVIIVVKLTVIIFFSRKNQEWLSLPIIPNVIKGLP